MIKKKIIRKRLDYICRLFFIFGFSSLVMFLIKNPNDLFLFYFTIISTFLAFFSVIIGNHKPLNDKICTFLWRKINNK